jgi:GDP-4-dehydro-6-deoxy-D-mannose reductase
VPRRILLTGAAGFVGRHLRACLAERFPEAALLATGEAAADGVTRMDVADAPATRAVLEEFRPDAVVHLAAVAAVPEANREADRAWQVNFSATSTLARALLRAAPEACFLFVSSAAVYGRSFRAAGGRPIAETMPIEPLDTYAATKAAAEMALSAMTSEGLRLVRLRPFNHIGPGQSAAFAVAAFAGQIARIEAGLQPPELAVGALTAERDFLDVRDVCAAYAATLARADTLPPGIAINIASGTARRIGAVLDELLALAKVPITIRTDPARLRPDDLPRSLGDPSLAERLLGWRPTIPWATTLADTLADCRRPGGFARLTPTRA